MNVIMERLAKLEAFLKKPADKRTQTTAVSGKVSPTNVTASLDGKDLGALKQRVIPGAKGKQAARKKNSGKLARKAGRQRVTAVEKEEMPVKQGRKARRRQRPRTQAPEPVNIPTDVPVVFDMYETTTIDMLVAGAPDFGAAVDQLFAAGVDLPPKARSRNSAPAKGKRQRNRSQQRKGTVAFKQHFATKTNTNVAESNILAAGHGTGTDQKLTDPLIEQISAKVAARISSSINQKLEKAKKTIQQKDNNYAVHIIGDWIPPSSEDSPPQMNMTVQVNRTNSKDLKVTAQGMTVEENMISKKTIDTANGKTSSVTVEPPKKNDKKNDEKKPTTSKDVLTVTVAPHPMMHYPWPYMYPTTMPAWMSNQENENQQPPQPMYPHYPQPYAYPPPQSGESQGTSGNYPQPPYGAHYPPPYPMYPHYPQWGRGQSGGGEAR